MKTRRLRNLEVSAIGMGCMGFSTAYGKIPEEKESIRLMREAQTGAATFTTRQKYMPLTETRNLWEKP